MGMPSWMFVKYVCTCVSISWIISPSDCPVSTTLGIGSRLSLSTLILDLDLDVSVTILGASPWEYTLMSEVMYG